MTFHRVCKSCNCQNTRTKVEVRLPNFESLESLESFGVLTQRIDSVAIIQFCSLCQLSDPFFSAPVITTTFFQIQTITVILGPDTDRGSRCGFTYKKKLRAWQAVKWRKKDQGKERLTRSVPDLRETVQMTSLKSVYSSPSAAHPTAFKYVSDFALNQGLCICKIYLIFDSAWQCNRCSLDA